MEELIKITENDGKQAVSARELYSKLCDNNMSHYSRWVKSNITDNQFATEGMDYIAFAIGVNVDNQLITNPNPTMDYALSIDFSKELCMLSKTQRGKEIRDYFISCEKKLKKIYKVPQTFSEALRLAANQAKQIEEQQRRIEVKDVQITEMTPKASYYDAVLSSKDALNISIIAKDYGMSGKFMNSLLHEWGIQYMCGKTWLVYKQYASMGYTKTDTPKYNKGNGEFGTTVHTKWTQKGRLFLYDIMKSHGYYPIMEQNNDNTLWN